MPALLYRSPSRRYLFLLKLFVGLVLLLHVGLIFRADKLLLSRPYFEDTFYAMSVSRWFSEGAGFSVDGIHPTNGVQPLICLLYTPLFAVSDGDLYLALRLTLLLQIALYLFAAWAAARFLVAASRQETDPKLLFWLSFALIYINYALSIQFLNGLETGLTVGLIFLTLGEFNRRERMQERRILPYLGVGLLLGLTILARVDAGILAVALVIWKVLTEHRRHSTKEGRARWGEFVRMVGQIGAMGVGAVVVSAPWWLYNLQTFGSFVPISGQSQQGLSTDLTVQIVETFNVFLEGLVAGVATPAAWRIGNIAWFGLLLLMVVGIFLAFTPDLRKLLLGRIQGFRNDWNLRSFAPLLLTLLGLSLFYTFIFGAPHFQARYLVLITVSILLFLIALGTSLWSYSTGSERGVQVIPLIPFVLFTLSIAFFFRNYTNTYENMMVDTVNWMEENVAPDDRVGIFQSGTVGFLYPQNVVNLDGKVNPEAFYAWEEGRFPEYVDSMKFDFIVDWQFYTDRIFRDSALRASYRRTDTLRNFMEVWEKVEGGEESVQTQQSGQ
ncbi:MAG: hypothetical protein AB7H80_06940 [Candidatus Kapaibacterium sp.]